MKTSRRDLLRYSPSLASLAMSPSAALAGYARAFAALAGPRSRTIYVNDLSGDPDGLFSAAHQMLSTATELRAVIGTGTGAAGETAEHSTALAGEMLKLTGRAPSGQARRSWAAARNRPRAKGRACIATLFEEPDAQTSVAAASRCV
jgi:hypothetical protein